ncbi:N-acetylated-alpha-linked acidic dipeptidase 2, partial [Halocaridina rubra]
WRPRRSILLLSWGAGEYGFFGATEWVEEYLKIFESRVVAYLNVDLALTFNYNLRISATPLLHKIITEALKATPAPDPSLDYKTLWDHWIDRNRAASPKLLDWEMASSSEHAPFYQRIGIPVLNMLWSHDNGLYNWTDYPLYHTAFEDFEAIKNILDPTFAYHLSLGHLWGLMTIGLADAKILPMNPEDETSMLEGMIEKLQEDFEDFFYAYDISIDPLKATIQKFSQVAKDFNTKLRNLSTIS